MKYVTAEQMQEIDRRAQEEWGIPGLILMENAGLRAADIALSVLRRGKHKQALIFCGPGNNGGDGFVIARHLANHAVAVRIFLLGDPQKLRGDALVNYTIARKMRIPVSVLSMINLRGVSAVIKRSGLIIDAIFGTGMNKAITGIYADTIEAINTSGVPVLAVDIPSGLCAATGKIFNVCVSARITVTFGAAKKGFITPEGKKYTGRVIVADIGLPPALLSAANRFDK